MRPIHVLLPLCLGLAAPAWGDPPPTTPGMDLTFDDDDCVLLPAPAGLKPAPGRFQPMVQEGEIGLVPSQDFLDMAETLAIMNQLAYVRGQNYRFGHELTYAQSLRGWDLQNLSAVRGEVARDPNAGFVAYHRGRNTLAVVMHGSINQADWLTNFTPVPADIREHRTPEGDLLPLPGRAHLGFLRKFLSCRAGIRQAVDRVLATLDPAQRDQLKIYVSGHSQGAALAQFITVDLCLRLEELHGPGWSNARENRVAGWFLASPAALDAVAGAEAEARVGKGNWVVQNTWLDVVPNVGLTPNGFEYRNVGIPVMQGSSDAALRAARAQARAVTTYLANGDWTAGLLGLVPVANLPAWLGCANHMVASDANYRGGLASGGFNPDMVLTTLADLNQGLQAAYDHQQEKLRARGWWSRLSLR
ncbi:lipase family protein [Mesoterricola sediminis]|uniref:Fungal lipase-type domain-containing protein n=1 Tax=Mesoterricola sediminis TaxID=2927980 RepID=A0AA48KAK3_9BACT|nr:hypothetical protein [Mesoterricola sediminis]BDU75154.1 hypothetical protein METESE_01120 [Mesoterricola sediminis]